MFKVGDKVRRISPVCIANEFDGWMSWRNTYTVIRAEPDRIVLEGCPTPDYTWHVRNFELVKDATKPHVHAELIKAWADGAKIQFHTGKKGDNWEDITNPMWYENHHYRIKPEPKPDTIVNTIVDVKHSWRNVSILCQWEGDVCPEGYKHNLDRIHVRYVFDGETGKCKDVKLISK